MFVDNYYEFCDATSVAATAGTALVGDVVDLEAIGLDLGNGQPVYVVITTDTEVITGGSAGTITIKVASDAQAAIATDGSATVHLTTSALVTDDAAVNAAVLNAGGVIMCAALPLGTYERYLGILSVVATTEVTAGKINAFLTAGPTGWKAYPNAI